MNAPTIKPGDVVVLKSGGPRMTVSSIDKDSSLPVCCYYFHGAELRSALLEIAHLEIAPQEPKDSGPCPPRTVRDLLAELERAMREKCQGRAVPRDIATELRGRLNDMVALVDAATMP